MRKKRTTPPSMSDRQVYALVKERAWSDALGCYLCEYGQHPMPAGDGQMAHKIPRSRSGKTTPENVSFVCRACHFRVDHGERTGDG